MSAWDTTKQEIITYPSHPWEGFPGWMRIDCGCCAGIEWGDPGPRECRDCGGGGFLALHEKSGVLAQYPGGPFCGKIPPKVAA